MARPRATSDSTVLVAAATPSTTGTPTWSVMYRHRSAIPAQPSTITSAPSSSTARLHSWVIVSRAEDPGISRSSTGISQARTLRQNPDMP